MSQPALPKQTQPHPALRLWWCSELAPPSDVLSACGVSQVGVGAWQQGAVSDVIIWDGSYPAIPTDPQETSASLPAPFLVCLGQATLPQAVAHLPWPCQLQYWQSTLQLLAHLRSSRQEAELLRQQLALAQGHLAVAEGQVVDVQERMLDLEHQASMAQLVRSLAHELNNPLAVMLGNSELIARDAGASPALLRRAATIAEQVDQCKEIITRLRKFARPQGEAAEGMHMAQVIAQAVQRLQRRGHAVPNVQVAEGLPQLRCGRQALVRSVEQVLDNAIRAGASKIAVYRDSSQASCAIAFANDGVSPSDEALRQACRPFFSERGGAGLGMSLAASLLADYQGKIALQAGPENKGAVTVISLPEWTPRADPSRTPSNARHRAIQRAQQRNVLVVEDDDLLAELIVLTAEELGWGVRVASSVDQLTTLAQQWRMDAIIADVNIAGGDGLMVLADIITQRPEMALVIMSGDIQQEKVQHFAAKHPCRLLAKPFRIQDLRRI